MPADITLYYDGDCPFCSRYVRYMRLKETVGHVSLVDLRADHDARMRLEAQKLDLDQGMVVEMEGRLYAGADAVHMLASLSGRHDALNRLHYHLFRSRRMAALFYPLLRAGRNLALLLLGRPAIGRPDRPVLHQYQIFAFVYAFFSLFHLLLHPFSAAPTPAAWIALGAAIGVALYPGSRRSFFVLVIAQLCDSWMQFPAGSNHAILNFFLLLTMAYACLRHALLGSRWEKVYADFAPAGRALLLIMYFFGIFHKINSGFLNPESSCAVVLMRFMPIMNLAADASVMQYMAIYGTFFFEGAVMLCLINKRYSYIGVALGVMFHSLITSSTYGFYQAFSTLTLALHALFLPKGTLERFSGTKFGAWLLDPGPASRAAKRKMFVLWLIVLVMIGMLPDTIAPFVVWLFFAAPFIVMVIRCGHDRGIVSEPYRLLSPLWGLNLIVALFFLNCVAPYLGLKTAQSMNMFANLRLEGGVSNHLILRHSPGPFPYLEDIVKIDGGTPELFQSYRDHDFAMVYYQLLDTLERHPEATVDFERRGVLYKSQSYATLKPDADRMLHSRLVRKFLDFSPAVVKEPIACLR